ncbi:polyisoprenoid-binding protein YceI [Neomicrococcus aestuarii]|uniref:Polyisoprenoid-binding protein YceI n=1 Tax=Neomicrococcus aestuarii TaxID=556325 RepID=A0A7W8X0Y6_9MICC|nr:YceI family protein [Neomicrococcus aestuarii]MBB5513348.1 polyisoprenoid-binding protein YceI [Neomicrococcus aestuarii]
MTALATGTWTLDMSHTDIAFVVRHAGISKVRGKFTSAEGTLEVAETVADSSVNVTIDAASFNSGDEGRDGHVKSADFFDVETFSTLKFVSTGVSGNDEEFELTGDLTIRDETHPVTLKVSSEGVAVDPFGATRAAFSGKTTISRKQWGLTWNAALEAGGVLVSDKVVLEIDAAFVKAA